MLVYLTQEQLDDTIWGLETFAEYLSELYPPESKMLNELVKVYKERAKNA